MAYVTYVTFSWLETHGNFLVAVDPASFRGGGIQPFPDNYAFKRHATEDRAQSGCLDGWEICWERAARWLNITW